MRRLGPSSGFSRLFPRERTPSWTLERFFSAFPARTCTILDLRAAQGQADTHERFYVCARPTRRSGGYTQKGFKRASDRTDLREKVRRRSGRRSVGYADGGTAAARIRGAAATASAAGSSGKGLSSRSLSPGRVGGGCCRPAGSVEGAVALVGMDGVKSLGPGRVRDLSRPGNGEERPCEGGRSGLGMTDEGVREVSCSGALADKTMAALGLARGRGPETASQTQSNDSCCADGTAADGKGERSEGLSANDPAAANGSATGGR